MTTLIAQGPVDVNVRGLLDRLQARADNAYCDYIGLCRRDECLGWEAKVEKQIFGEAELKALNRWKSYAPNSTGAPS